MLSKMLGVGVIKGFGKGAVVQGTSTITGT